MYDKLKIETNNKFDRKGLISMKMTQRQKVIDYIKKCNSITSWEAYKNLEITQFATRIKELKDQGYVFRTQWEKRKNVEGKLIRFKRYYFGSNSVKNDKK